MTTILDANGVTIEVGSRVRDDDSGGGTVTEILDADGDVDGETGRIVGFGPYVVVLYDDGAEERWLAQTTATGPWDHYGAPYRCDDVEVIA